jgi:D-alanyl-lipoteichoic acid acyltransferase DltB (MBOAT superfamily)
MSLSSYEFVLLFLPVSVFGFWWLRQRFGRATALRWLILMSAIFYARTSLLGFGILLPSILFDFLIARAILRTANSRARFCSALFIVGVSANILFLGYFKYRNFFLDTIAGMVGAHFSLTSLLLPLGISFLTFQKIAFLSDVRSGVVQSVPLQEYLLFTLFFPRTVAGPIVHYQELVPQLADSRPKDLLDSLTAGITLFFIGMFKKAVVADGISEFVPYNDEGPITLFFAWSSTLAYLFQLYFDFSGYSDMALGAARLLGVRLPMNFNSPLKATSIVEFWSRWHITLTRFLTAYIYTPLVLSITRSRMAKGKPVLRGKRSSASAIWSLVAIPTLVTMGISGLWHGAGWQFVAWGLLHGLYLTVNQTWRMLRPRLWPDRTKYERVMKPVGFVLTFLAVVVALVFFQADSLDSALSRLAGMVGLHGILPQYAQILRSLDIDADWTAFWRPFWPFSWLIALLLAIVLLPNSLEFLRRFDPALDFPENEPAQNGRDEKQPLAYEATLQPLPFSFMTRLRTTWRRIGEEGISLTRFTALILAVLSAWGLLALSHAGKFIYEKF